MHPGLGIYLDRLTREYGPEYLHTDPIGAVRRFDDADDQEIAGFLAAGLAFGRVNIILPHLEDLWGRLDQEPARVVHDWTPSDRKRLRGFVHRWVSGSDLAHVLDALGRVRRRHGSLRSLFLEGYDPAALDLASVLSRFVNALKHEIPDRARTRGVLTFLPDPAQGAACKRLNLYLRWMVRPEDGIDLGLWKPVRPDQLVMPLDTHVSRLSRYLGLTERRTVNWKMAAEIAARLRTFDPLDPIRFDFALSRLGILEACPRRVNPILCRACSLVSVCTLGREAHVGV
ncbi:MAG TPA: TIGR02757 family protein [Candidatus Eisenbacteria bacterium]|nr:TIGR02757 family protein [Candidatus Eisenbacteria bacterium]